jgi:dTDP-4-dehydrorhamnose 3,5-epimerase-like enzyme
MDSVKSTLDDCKIIDLRKISDPRGNLTVIEENTDVPFDIKRVYYLYDVPGGESRGAHAHKQLYQLIIAASGSFTVTLDDGTNKKTFNLKRSYYGLLVVPGIWRDLDDFSSGSVLLCLASEHYDEKDYIRDYQEFLKFKGLN